MIQHNLHQDIFFLFLIRFKYEGIRRSKHNAVRVELIDFRALNIAGIHQRFFYYFAGFVIHDIGGKETALTRYVCCGNFGEGKVKIFLVVETKEVMVHITSHIAVGQAIETLAANLAFG